MLEYIREHDDPPRVFGLAIKPTLFRVLQARDGHTHAPTYTSLRTHTNSHTQTHSHTSTLTHKHTQTQALARTHTRAHMYIPPTQGYLATAFVTIFLRIVLNDVDPDSLLGEVVL